MSVAICYSSSRKLNQYIPTYQEELLAHSKCYTRIYITNKGGDGPSVECAELVTYSEWVRDGVLTPPFNEPCDADRRAQSLTALIPLEVPTAKLEMKSQHINLGGIKHLVWGINLLTFVLDLRNRGRRGKNIQFSERIFFTF